MLKARKGAYIEDLYADLKDPKYAAEYLKAALEDDEEGASEVFLLALRDVACANKMTEVAKHAEVSRESLYRTLSKSGNPKLSTIMAILKTLGVRLSICPVSDLDEGHAPIEVEKTVSYMNDSPLWTQIPTYVPMVSQQMTTDRRAFSQVVPQEYAHRV
jgi:probable addiction module antidote protein